MATITGTLFSRLEKVTGQGQKGEWLKQDFVIETLDEKYPKKVCLTAWNETADPIRMAKKGDTLTVEYNPESREHNGRWYTELRVKSITSEGHTAVQQPKAQRQNAAPAKRQTASASNEDRYGALEYEADDSLPF
jgi:hypothetical protein